VTDSSCIGHEPCPACGSRDNLARYDDGHGYCFGCQYYEKGDGSVEFKEAGTFVASSSPYASSFLSGEYVPLPRRGLTIDTVRKYGYRVNEERGVQIADFYDASGRLCAQKTRDASKQFKWIGDSKASTLFGQHLWRPGRRVWITEGEIDAMSLAQVHSLKWPVVSVRNGVGSAEKDLRAQLEWLEGFEEIVLAFDNDEPGQKCAAACAELFTPGKVRIMALPGGFKDANAMLVAGQHEELRRMAWDARPWRPDGIVKGTDLIDRLLQPPPPSIPYPWEGLNTYLRGQRRGELTTWCAGTGVGKSQVMREITYHLRSHGEQVGVIALEESVVRAALSQVGLLMGKRLHDPSVRETLDPEHIADAAKKALDGVYFYEHKGVRDTAAILSRIRYMAKGLGVRWIILDHISIMISGTATDGDERKRIDELMTKVGALGEELEIGIHAVSHLRKADGTPHEEGGRVSLDDLRGSASIKQVSYNIVALERNQQAPTVAERNSTLLRVLKCREFGDTGEACRLTYSADTGRLTEGPAMAPADENSADGADF
jgi:twinkle protein